MTTSWYLVRLSWPSTSALWPTYCGLGGDVWPLGEHGSAQAIAVHDGLMSSRRYVRVGDYEEAVCIDRDLAIGYAATATALGIAASVIECTESPDAFCEGFDIGNPTGGYSLIESEILVRDDAHRTLNSLGLFPSRGAAEQYLVFRRDENLEEADDLSIVGISRVE